MARWPLPEVLQGYLHQLRRDAIAQHNLATEVWASLAPHQKKRSEPPKLPDLLRRPRSD